MLAHALLNELFNVFPISIHVKVCEEAMLSFQNILNIHYFGQIIQNLWNETVKHYFNHV